MPQNLAATGEFADVVVFFRLFRRFLIGFPGFKSVPLCAQMDFNKLKKSACFTLPCFVSLSV